MPAFEQPADISIEEMHVPGLNGDPDVRVKVYKPTSLPPEAPGILWIHGGGMVLGTADWDDDVCTPMAQEHQCVVVSVDYRLAPEDPALPSYMTVTLH